MKERRGDGETGSQGDRETGRQRDGQTGRGETARRGKTWRGDAPSPFLPVTVSPRLFVFRLPRLLAPDAPVV